jgi:hypothetical protein
MWKYLLDIKPFTLSANGTDVWDEEETSFFDDEDLFGFCFMIVTC